VGGLLAEFGFGGWHGGGFYGGETTWLRLLLVFDCAGRAAWRHLTFIKVPKTKSRTRLARKEICAQ